MHHMTANWSPIAQEERHQLCYGVWAVIGTTREWPQVVNLWEEDGFKGLSQSLDRECNNPSVQDPKLAKWWAEAANYRSRGVDRVLVPAPWTRTIEELCAEGVHGALVRARAVPASPGHLRSVPRRGARGGRRALRGVRLRARRRVGNRDDERGGMLPALVDPDVRAVGRVRGRERSDAGLARWRKRSYDLSTHQHRFLLVDSPLSPMRIGRQPSRDDRQPGWDDL